VSDSRVRFCTMPPGPCHHGHAKAGGQGRGTARGIPGSSRLSSCVRFRSAGYEGISTVAGGYAADSENAGGPPQGAEPEPVGAAGGHDVRPPRSAGESRSDPPAAIPADLKAATGPPVHPLRRVIANPTGQRTHPRRVAANPGTVWPPSAGTPVEASSNRPKTSVTPTPARSGRAKHGRRVLGWTFLGAGVLVVVVSVWLGLRL
jgi:hypothetical protein